MGEFLITHFGERTFEMNVTKIMRQKMILKENKMCNSVSRHIGKYEFCLVLYSLEFNTKKYSSPNISNNLVQKLTILMTSQFESLKTLMFKII